MSVRRPHESLKKRQTQQTRSYKVSKHDNIINLYLYFETVAKQNLHLNIIYLLENCERLMGTLWLYYLRHLLTVKVDKVFVAIVDRWVWSKYETFTLLTVHCFICHFHQPRLSCDNVRTTIIETEIAGH